MQMVSSIENSMVAALKAAATSFRVETIESYAGQLDDDLLDWVRALPAMWVVFAGAGEPQPVASNHGKWRFKGEFIVFCGQRNLAGNQAVRQGDARNPGVYALMELAAAALLNKDFGLAITPLKPGPITTATSQVVSRDSVMVYGMRWRTEWVQAEQVLELSPAGVLASIGLEYFLKPGDQVADAADLVTTT